MFRLWFSFKNNRRTNVLLVGIFENAHKKIYWLSKTPFWPFLAVNNVFLCVFKITDQNNLCVSIVLKTKTETNLKKIGWPSKKSIFEFWNKKYKKKFSYNFFFWFSFKNSRPTHIILISIFENKQKTIINRQKRPKWRFWRSITFFVRFQKYQPKEHLCVYCF